jgi:hypothetical protein
MKTRKPADQPTSVPIAPAPGAEQVIGYRRDGGQRTDDGTYPNVGEERAKVDERAAASAFTGEFPSANRSSDAPDYSPALRRVVETIFLKEDEIEATARDLVVELRIGDARNDYGTVMRRLDEAEDNARKAHRLWVTARAERERYELDAQAIEGALRERAIALINSDRLDEKVATGKSKTVTEADVKLKIASQFADEWTALEHERSRLKLAVEHFEHQVGNWASRCRSLQTIAGKLR